MIEVQHVSPRKALLYPSAQVYDWGTTLVVAPYPNHQLLSCGGAIALLRQMGYRVRTLYVGNGRSTSSERHSASITQQETVQRESLEAMAYVGICPEASVYLQLYDGLFPRRGEPGFEESVRLIINELGDFEPDTVVMPMLTHDQPDLVATWEILQEALRRFASSIRVIEYALLTSDAHVSKPTAEHKVWRLDVKEVLDKKVKALQRFQRSRDAIASVLDTIHPWETYVEYQ